MFNDPLICLEFLKQWSFFAFPQSCLDPGGARNFQIIYGYPIYTKQLILILMPDILAFYDTNNP